LTAAIASIIIAGMKKLLPLLVLLIATPCLGQYTKGSLVIPKFSRKNAVFDEFKIWQAKPKYVVNVTASADTKIAIDGRSDWNRDNFPWVSQFQVKEFRASDKKAGRILLDNGAELVEINLAPGMDTKATTEALLFSGTVDELVQSEYFRTLELQLLPKMFTGPLDLIPYEKQRRLARHFEYADGFASLSLFKEKSYLSVTVPNTVTYNTIQLNAAERAARTTERVIPRLKSMYESFGRLENIEGIKIITTISSRDFVKERYRRGQNESFELYVPFDLLDKFTAADITNQDLVDGSVLLINGSRVKVNLSSFS
jgi:hypothetical protein